MNYALITGASSGIGLALANEFASHGYGLVLVARDEQKLSQVKSQIEEKHKVTVEIIVKDLTADGAAEYVYNSIKNEGLEIAVLVNNAGYGVHADFLSEDFPRQRGMITLNLGVLTELSYMFGRDMVQARAGKILNIASTASFLPGPHMNIYYATKSYVLSFSQALADELRSTGVTVSVVCPGPTWTDFQKESDVGETNLIKYWPAMEALDVARKAYKGLMAGKRVIIPGVQNKLLDIAIRISPRVVVLLISRWSLQK